MRFPKPPKEAVIFRDAKLTVCLASFPVAKGHTIVFWNAPARDLHRLSRRDYERLMGAVEDARDALMSALKVKKVYLLYMDEANHVHWHLIPRYGVKGFTALSHRPTRLRDFSLAASIRKRLRSRH
ncbi:MAG TPA: HIT family protein [Patescibacteria group bacterium]|nr:HIT family protein [Patescibacteria group bacterium]